MMRTAALLALAMSLSAADKRVITPAGGIPPVGPYSPGILVGDYLYVSGQGALRPEGGYPEGVEAQTAQCLTNVRRIVEGAGLTMRNVVYATVYLKDPSAADAMDRAWRAVFSSNLPPRVVIGTARMPVDTPVEITVVASRTAPRDRVYVGGVASHQAVLETLKTAGLDERHIVFANSFPNPPAFTAIASRTVPKRSGACALAGGTLFCPAQSADGPDIESQVRGTMKGLDAELRRAGMTFANVVATNVYLDNVDDFARMNKVYAESFGAVPPTRTTIQLSLSTGKPLVRIALIAVK